MSGIASSSRLDRRAAIELRPLQLSLGQLDRADGSGRFGFGASSTLQTCLDVADGGDRKQLRSGICLWTT